MTGALGEAEQRVYQQQLYENEEGGREQLPAEEQERPVSRRDRPGDCGHAAVEDTAGDAVDEDARKRPQQRLPQPEVGRSETGDLEGGQERGIPQAVDVGLLFVEPPVPAPQFPGEVVVLLGVEDESVEVGGLGDVGEVTQTQQKGEQEDREDRGPVCHVKSVLYP